MPYPGECEPFELGAVDPAPWQEDVQTNPLLALTYTGYPDPLSVSVETIVLTTGPFRRVGKYRVDLPGKRILFRPTVRLEPYLTHALTVFRGLRSVQGCRPTRDELSSFRTGAGPGPEPPEPRDVGFSEVLPILGAHCGGTLCHRDDGPDRPTTPCGPAVTPPRGLSLCDDRAYDHLVGVPSVEVASLLRVNPGDAAQSYLLRKILPGRTPESPMPGVPGERMGPRLSEAERRTIADWIDTGARR